MDRRHFVGAALLVPLQQSLAPRLFGASKILDAIGLAPRDARVRNPRATGILITDPVPPTPAEPCADVDLHGFDRADLKALNGLDHTCYEKLRTPDYFLPPPNMDPGPNQGLDENEGRVTDIVRRHAALRDATGMGDAKKILVNAVLMALGIPITAGPISFAPDPTLATVLAQLAVTGRQAFDVFKVWKPKDADLVKAVHDAMPGTTFDNAKLKTAATMVLDTAYTALWTIRANVAGWRAQRSPMGWIATSGEDDLPHRPVNIPTAPYPQHDVEVSVKLDDGSQLAVTTRYIVAAPQTFLDPATARPPLPAAGKLRTLPDETAAIPPKLKLIIFIPGGGSRAEEAVGFLEKLIAAGADRQQSYAVIALDLPNSGYSKPFDHTKVAAATASFRPDAAPEGDAQMMSAAIAGYPLFTFEERFIVSFIETLDRQFGNVKNRIVAVMGGSLGGNMSLQLARRSSELPYLGTIVAWSSTCFAPITDLKKFMVGHQFAGAGGDMIGRFQEMEQPSTRHEWFKRVWVDNLAEPGRNAGAGALVGAIAGAVAGTLVLGPAAGVTTGVGVGTIVGLTESMPSQPTMWYSESWQPCKLLHIVAGRLDRFEYYTPEHRRWNDRLNYEMALFSFQEADVYTGTKTQGPARYLTMTSRLLLAAGADDDYKNVNNYTNTRDVADKMANTPGRTLFLLGTGHSIHAECPVFFSKEIVKFLVDGT
jgi:pimeloyl-ACP methyl ester carboxylesterase